MHSKGGSKEEKGRHASSCILREGPGTASRKLSMLLRLAEDPPDGKLLELLSTWRLTRIRPLRQLPPRIQGRRLEETQQNTYLMETMKMSKTRRKGSWGAI